MPITIRDEAFESAAAQTLVGESVAELRARYGGRGEPAAPDAAGCLVWLVAWDGDAAVGCGGLWRFSDDEVELKRMYVVPSARGQGVSRLLLRELERAASRNGYRGTRLETGARQPEALGLYAAEGYETIPCWAPYADDPDSICLGKRLAQATEPHES